MRRRAAPPRSPRWRLDQASDTRGGGRAKRRAWPSSIPPPRAPARPPTVKRILLGKLVPGQARGGEPAARVAASARCEHVRPRPPPTSQRGFRVPGDRNLEYLSHRELDAAPARFPAAPRAWLSSDARRSTSSLPPLILPSAAPWVAGEPRRKRPLLTKNSAWQRTPGAAPVKYPSAHCAAPSGAERAEVDGGRSGECKRRTNWATSFRSAEAQTAREESGWCSWWPRGSGTPIPPAGRNRGRSGERCSPHRRRSSPTKNSHRTADRPARRRRPRA